MRLPRQECERPLWIPLLVAAPVVVGLAACSPTPVTSVDLDQLTLRAVAPGEDDGGALILEGLPARRFRALERAVRAAADASTEQADWARVVKITPAPVPEVEVHDLPATAGSFAIRRDALVFRPRYALVSGLVYRAELRLPTADGDVPHRTLRTRLPAGERTRRTQVVAIYPSGDRLPENQLKLYLHFSRTMGSASPWRYLRLLDDDGRDVPNVFHQAAELWDPTRQRLTVLFDPGRIKRGLANHEAFGPPLTRGQRYRLVVAADWPDADGRALQESFEKPFEVGPPDRSRPAPASWRLVLPRAGSRDPLVVHFDEPLDHALLWRSLVVRAEPTGTTLVGERRIARGEERWELVPRRPWRAGAYHLRIDPLLEDLAGNNLLGLFDTDLASAEPRRPSEPHLRPFRVEPPHEALQGDRR